MIRSCAGRCFAGYAKLRYAGALDPALDALTASEDLVRLEAVSVLGC